MSKAKSQKDSVPKFGIQTEKSFSRNSAQLVSLVFVSCCIRRQERVQLLNRVKPDPTRSPKVKTRTDKVLPDQPSTLYYLSKS